MVPPPTAPAPLAAPHNYATRYDRQRDAFNGQYAALYKNYDASTGLSSEDLFETVVSSAQNIPKVFLAQVTIGGDQRIVSVHRPSKYEADLAHPESQWDGQVIAFLGDIRRGSNFIKTVTLQADVFTATDAQRVPTLATMDTLWQADYEKELLDRLVSSDRASESVTTRHVIPVPPAYVSLVLGKTLTPREAWTLLSTAITSDSRTDACRPLLDWLRVASTARRSPTEPATSLGDINDVFPPVIDDSQIDRHRWNIIIRDIPALGPLATPLPAAGATAAAQQPLLDFLTAFQADRAAERAQDEARRVAEKVDKLPSATKYRTIARDWMAFCSVGDESDLPPLYIQLVNADKGEHLALLRNAIRERARHPDAATSHTPVVSKETKDMVLTARFGVEPHLAHDLSLGLQPFSLGLFIGDELSKTVDLRATNYETMLQGMSAPTLGEQASFSTKEIRIPQDPFTAGMMLCSTSVQLDVLQGPHHAFAGAFRHFCLKQWPSIATTLHLSSRYNAALAKSVIPRILRWVQTHMVTYTHQLMLNNGALSTPLPPFSDLLQLISLQQFHLLPELPDSYRLLPPADHSPPVRKTASPPRDNGQSPSTPPTPSTKPKATNPTAGRGGSLVTNPTVTAEWKQRLEASSKRIRDISKLAPASTDTDDNGQNLPICLSYHLRGHCYSSCNRTKTHRPLSESKTAAVASLVAEQLHE